MKSLLSFCRREPVLSIAALAALLTCFFTPPSAAYIGYIDFRTLALLYALMVAVAMTFSGSGSVGAVVASVSGSAASVEAEGRVIAEWEV